MEYSTNVYLPVISKALVHTKRTEIYAIFYGVIRLVAWLWRFDIYLRHALFGLSLFLTLLSVLPGIKM